MRKQATGNVPEASRYPIEVFYSEDDAGFIAIAKDLPGCSAWGRLKRRPSPKYIMRSELGRKLRGQREIPCLRRLNRRRT